MTITASALIEPFFHCPFIATHERYGTVSAKAPFPWPGAQNVEDRCAMYIQPIPVPKLRKAVEYKQEKVHSLAKYYIHVVLKRLQV
jgi:hypothetical protein